MKKIILSIILLVVIAIAVGIYYVFTNLDSLVKAAIETHGSEATQTAVRVDKVNIDLANGAAGLSGLSIANPGGYAFPNAFTMGEIRGAIDLKSLQEEPYVINEITVLAPQVFVEINEGNKTNLNELKNNLTAGAAPSAANTEAPQTSDQSSTPGPRLIIRRVTFADGNIQARVAVLDNKELNLKLPNLDMSNLGGKNGATGEELAREILNRLTDHATREVKNKVIDQEIEKLKAKAQAKVDEEKAKLESKVDAEKEEQKQKAEDKLKDLLSR
jgi:hypothetical protein